MTDKTKERKKYVLITRSDFDGIVCAMLLKSLDLISEIRFVHPKDMQDGKIPVSGENITANLPYVEGVHIAFDHHLSEALRVGRKDRHVIDPCALSAARVIYNYYGGEKKFPHISPDIIEAVDKADSASYTKEEILNPERWILLNFIMDARTGVGRFHDFRISNQELMHSLVDICARHSIDEIMTMPDIVERVDMYFAHQKMFVAQLQKCTVVHKNLAVIDLRDEDVIYTGNRFMVYALFPEVNISMHVIWGKDRSNTVFAVGKSILNRTSETNVGELMLKHGGGGHIAAGTCQIENMFAEEIKTDLIKEINADG